MTPTITVTLNDLDKLPAEVRIKVYQHLFTNAKLTVYQLDRYDHEDLHPQILLTSHKIRSEALPYLARLLDLHITYDKVATIQKHLATDFLCELRKLTIFSYDELDNSLSDGHNLQRLLPPFSNLPKFLPALQTLEIRQLGIDSSHFIFPVAETKAGGGPQTEATLLRLLFDRVNRLLTQPHALATAYYKAMFDEDLAQLFKDPERRFQLLLCVCFYPVHLERKPRLVS